MCSEFDNITGVVTIFIFSLAKSFTGNIFSFSPISLGRKIFYNKNICSVENKSKIGGKNFNR